VNRPLLNTSIALTGILLSILNFTLKPAPDEKLLQQYAQNMTNSTEWQGRIAPDFELKTSNGESFRLSENVGKKIIVLNFFATWCGPCREEMPELNTYFKAHKAESLVLLGIDAEEKQDRVDAFLADLKVDFPSGIDAGPIQKQYGVGALPTTGLRANPGGFLLLLSPIRLTEEKAHLGVGSGFVRDSPATGPLADRVGGARQARYRKLTTTD
jgi:thiol-disulfide isomerase/thioredoxin